tara:strand:+ start:60 stop:1820 length:1761 start_codon:yes stop_codon:yes gene_type:complete
MDIELKNQSVVEIGKAVGDNVNSMIPQSQALVPAGATAPAVEPMPMNPFDSMMAVLEDVRDGVYALVDKFSDSVSLQKDQIQDEAMAQDLAQVGGGEDTAPPEDEAGDDRSFLQKGKDKISELMGAGGLKGMLIKGGLIFGLLGIAKLMQKYGKQIAETVAPIVDGIKSFFSAFSDDIGPLFDKAVAMVKDAIGGLLDIFKGLFTGDASTFFSGVKKIFIDFPIKLVSYIGDSFFSLIENALAAFGIESKMVTDIKLFFRQLPEKISELFTNIGKFFTETIPQKLEEIKTSITNFFNDKIVTPIKGLFTDIGNFFTVTVPEKFTEVSNKVTSFFTDIVSSIGGFFTDSFNFVTQTIPEKIGEITKSISDKFVEIKDKIIDFALTPFRKVKELFENLIINVLESLEGIPLIGGKAKEMKENILADREIAAQEQEQKETEAAAFDNLQKDLVKHEDKINAYVAASGLPFDLEGSLYHYNKGVKKLRFASGDTSSNILTSNFEDDDKMKMLMMNSNAAIQGQGETTGGATGGELNNAGAEFVGAGNPTGGSNVNVVNEGAKVNTVSANQTHMSEDTNTNDKNARLDLYD